MFSFFWKKFSKNCRLHEDPPLKNVVTKFFRISDLEMPVQEFGRGADQAPIRKNVALIG